MWKTVWLAVLDMAKAVGVGLIIGTVPALLVALLAWGFTRDFAGALVMGQRIPLLLGASGLLIFSGLLLKKGGLPPLKNQESYSCIFPVIPYGWVLLLISGAVLISASILDSWIWLIR